ncbi:MAG: hypothetical protein M3O01_13655, partial [Pseudomonadota bacterium]|nr:hypothetical protein [Pseudomonadota bacterium]
MSDGRLSRIASELPAILRPHLLALGAASGVLAIAAWWLAWPRGEGANPSPLFFVPHLLLAWLAWRGRPFATATATLLLAVGLLGAQA